MNFATIPITLTVTQNKLNILYNMEDDFYLNKLKKTFDDVDEITDKYKNASSFEKFVLFLKEKQYTYEEIQRKVGKPQQRPSKKVLKEIIKKYNPNLRNIDCNRHKLISPTKPSKETLYLRQLCFDRNQFEYDIGKFYIKDDNRLYFYNDNFEELDYDDQYPDMKI